jgi:hypothetical protein
MVDKLSNPFKRHRIDHLSASSINQFIMSPAKFILTVSGYRDEFGSPAMWRGIAVEEGIVTGLKDRRLSLRSIHEVARNRFIKLKDDYIHAERDKPISTYDMENMVNRMDKELKALPVYLEASVPYFRDLGKPTDYQKKIELELEGIPVPIIGYTDLQYKSEAGNQIVRDIKTVAKLPSKNRSTVERQLAIYAMAENAVPIVDYVCSSRGGLVESRPVENIEQTKKEIIIAVRAMAKLLSLSEDVSEIAQFIYPNFDDWIWSKNEIKQAKKLWSIE